MEKTVLYAVSTINSSILCLVPGIFYFLFCSAGVLTAVLQRDDYNIIVSPALLCALLCASRSIILYSREESKQAMMRDQWSDFCMITVNA